LIRNAPHARCAGLRRCTEGLSLFPGLDVDPRLAPQFNEYEKEFRETFGRAP
jgi:hypothetical protein